MPTKDLKIAYIKPINGKMKDTCIEVLFNPAEYTIEKGNQFQSTSLPGLATPVTQFVTGQADTLTMELFFDTYAISSRHNKGEKDKDEDASKVIQREDVRKYTQKIAALMDVDSELHAPPICQFSWGPPLGSPKGEFIATIEKLSQKFTMFLDDGIPVRATLNVTFKEYKTVEQQLQEIGRKSADRTKRHVVKQGDSVWALAGVEYQDPGMWREIAAKNLLQNPRVLEPGKEIVLPPLGVRR